MEFQVRELAGVTDHQVYALVIGHQMSECAERLCHYDIDKVLVYDHSAFADFRIEPYTAAFYDFIEKENPPSILI